MRYFERTDDPCSHCGTCLSYCLWDRFERENPGQSGSSDLCRDCMACYSICARVHTPDSFEGAGIFGTSERHPLLGMYRAAWSGSATPKASRAQDGGVTTVLLQAMLEQGMIDCALVVGRDARWRPVATPARTIDEIYVAAGSKYTTAPAMVDLSSAMESCRHLAIVALPCQTTAVRNLMRRGSRYSPERIVAILGLFCYETFRYEGIRALVEGQFELPMDRVSRFDIKKNRLVFFQEDSPDPLGGVPIAELQPHTWPVCLSCTDFTAELADVSLGAVSSRAGENTILVRTDRGSEIVGAAARLGMLELGEWRNPGIVERISENKRKRRSELSPEDARFILKQTIRGNYKKLKLRGQW